MTVAIILSLIILTPIAKIFISIAWPNAIEDVDGATDLRLPPFSDYAELREGFSHGKFNNEGYNNLYNYERGMSLDILLMGSSNMQACNVMPELNTANVLMKISGRKLYNIGVGSHHFLVCANNLEAAVRKYKPSDYVVIESMYVSFSDKELQDALSSNVEKIINTGSLGENVGALRSMYRKYIRDAFQNVSKSLLPLYFMKNNVFFSIQNYIGVPEKFYAAPSNPVLLSQLLKGMAETVRNSGVKLIIAYHPGVRLERDGSLRIESNPEAVKIFADACESNGIYFVDMSERFSREYAKNFTVPNGFFNTSIGKGHLNRYGHRMFAEEIYKTMQRIEVN